MASSLHHPLQDRLHDILSVKARQNLARLSTELFRVKMELHAPNWVLPAIAHPRLYNVVPASSSGHYTAMLTSYDADLATDNTPLAPSVEKAYYRKCIELKRRLNEVETANDEAKIRRVRLDRAILKMRLERAFLLDQLSKRMEHNVDGSDGSGDENPSTVSEQCKRKCDTTIPC